MTAQAATNATRTTWQVDPHSTYVQFAIRHMQVSTVRGRFPDVSGTIVVDTADPAASLVDLVIGAASLDTGAAARDEYVRSEACLDVAQHPTITFCSAQIEALGDGAVRVVGTLTIRGAAREVILDGRYNGAVLSPFGNRIAGFEARTTLTLADLGVDFNLPMPEGGFALGETLAVELLVEATEAA